MTETGFHAVDMKRSYPIEPLEYVPCPLCDTRDDHVLALKGFPNDIPVRNVICKGCGLIRVDPRMSRQGYELFYKEDFFGYLNPFDRPAYVLELEHTKDDVDTPTKTRLMPYIRPYVKQGARVLDVGAGFGQTLYLLQKEKGATYIGLEPDPYSRAVAKERIGVDLTDMTVEDFLEKNTESFDFMILDQTYEHLLTPLEALQGLAKRLAPDGVIYIGVPGAYNPLINMSLFYQIAHTYNYTPHTMRLLADKAGLKVISVRDPEGYPLEVLLAHKESSYPEESMERMVQGSDWRDVARRLKRKRRLNVIRGTGKRIVERLFGDRVREKIRSTIDRLTGYRY